MAGRGAVARPVRSKLVPVGEKVVQAEDLVGVVAGVSAFLTVLQARGIYKKRHKRMLKLAPTRGNFRVMVFLTFFNGLVIGAPAAQVPQTPPC